VKVSPTQMTIGPRRSGVFRVQITVPRGSNAAISSVRAVRIRAVAPGVDEEGWASSGEYPVLIVAHNPKATSASLECKATELVRRSAQHNPTATILRLRNTGGRIARASGRVFLERTSGQEIAHMDIGAYEPELILPGGEREFRMRIPPLDKGTFRIRAEIFPGPGGGEKAVVEEEFETYIDIPEGLKKASEEPSETGVI